MHKTDWMYEKKWGVFLHYLEGQMNDPANPRSLGRHTSWDACINDFDCDWYASQLAEAGAGWVILTIVQMYKYMIAPNETYNRITGYKPGEACPQTDFIQKMLDALEPYGIDLLLYFTGDGPSRDERASAAFHVLNGGSEPNPEFVDKWSSVAREYSLRYGKRIKGWWHDGCWDGYTTEWLKTFADAFRAGNPDSLIATNIYGCMDPRGVLYENVLKGAPFDDYTAGEQVRFGALPYAPFMENARWHILSFLGEPRNKVAHDGWGAPGCSYTPGWMYDYVDKVHDLGGIVTIDTCVYRDGTIEPSQRRVLNVLKTV